MAYEKQNFQVGQILKAEEMNHIEDGIAAVEEALQRHQDELSDEINAALAQAKESGEFDGVDGQDGKDGKDGTNGINGADGKDGVSPTITVENISGGHRVTISDATGTQYFDVMDGEDGTGSGGGLPFELEESTAETAELISNRTFTANSALPMTPIIGELVVGQTYILTVDGVECTCVCETANTLETTIDGAAVKFIRQANGNRITYSGKGSATVTVSLSTIETVQQVPAKNVAQLPMEKINGLVDALKNGTGGGVSSWNDLTDRPFYAAETTLLQETEFAFVESDGIYVSEQLFEWNLSEGQSMTVSYNGTVYTCEVQNIYGGLVFGNPVLFGAEDNGLPFLWITEDNLSFGVISVVGDASATISIITEAVVQLDKKYVPISASDPVLIDYSGIIALNDTDPDWSGSTTTGYTGVTQEFLENLSKRGVVKVKLRTNFLYIDASGGGSVSEKTPVITMLVNDTRTKFKFVDDEIVVAGIQSVGLSGFLGAVFINLVIQDDGTVYAAMQRLV